MYKDANGAQWCPILSFNPQIHASCPTLYSRNFLNQLNKFVLYDICRLSSMSWKVSTDILYDYYIFWFCWASASFIGSSDSATSPFIHIIQQGLLQTLCILDKSLYNSQYITRFSFQSIPKYQAKGYLYSLCVFVIRKWIINHGPIFVGFTYTAMSHHKRCCNPG